MLAFLRIFSNSHLANSESVRWNELNTKVGGLRFCPRHLCCLNDYKTLLLKIENYVIKIKKHTFSWLGGKHWCGMLFRSLL